MKLCDVNVSNFKLLQHPFSMSSYVDDFDATIVYSSSRHFLEVSMSPHVGCVLLDSVQGVLRVKYIVGVEFEPTLEDCAIDVQPSLRSTRSDANSPRSVDPHAFVDPLCSDVPGEEAESGVPDPSHRYIGQIASAEAQFQLHQRRRIEAEHWLNVSAGQEALEMATPAATDGRVFYGGHDPLPINLKDRTLRSTVITVKYSKLGITVGGGHRTQRASIGVGRARTYDPANHETRANARA